MKAFKSDDVVGGYSLASSSNQSKPSRGGAKREHRSDRHGGGRTSVDVPAAIDEDEEIRKAIELSKVTAQKEEERRIEETRD